MGMGMGMDFHSGNNGTVLAGYPQADLKTAIDTAADFTQMQVQINLKGSQFGVSAKQTPQRRSRLSMLAINVQQSHVKVTIDNNHPLGRLDQWNLTWEWMRNEFINNMRGAYTHKKDPSECIYGPQGQYYRDFDFSTVMSCQRSRSSLTYLLRRNGRQDRKAGLTRPTNVVLLFESIQQSDPSGIDATISAIASWQVTCNMTSPKPQQAKCCVSYSAYYADGAVPCNTCACGCENQERCDKNASPLLLPSDALLVPFANRSQKALAFARLKHNTIPKKLPCPDNCGLKKAYGGYSKVHSFNATKMSNVKNTIFMKGLPGLNYLVGEINGTHPDRDPAIGDLIY
ncbi:UNVERIFIED_CONTAM: COBRA-like protein 10 [Sesamum radiatum]|uniref:COBRA-like protein 10 n=1 Tax=Sesamum radiatum TaxID=300843 RepID=A0AAW2T3E4_SESRA